MRPNRSIFLSSAVAVFLVIAALWVGGKFPFQEHIRAFLAALPSSTLPAATPLGVSQGLPNYSGYPSPATCNTGDSLCYPTTRIGVFSIVSQTDSNAGQTNYINFQNTTGSVGTPVVLQNINPTTVQWSCQNSQTVGTQVYAGQVPCGCTGNNCCSWNNPCCCQQYCPSYTWQYATYNFATNAIIADPQGNTVFNANGALYGTSNVVLGGPAGTYDVGQTVNYTLSCIGGGTNPVPPVPVTMGSTVTQTTLSANPTIVRAGLDTSTLTITASGAVDGSCKLIAPNGSTLKTYSGTSVDDTLQVGPFGNVSDPQIYQIVCVGPEGFNSRKSVSLTVKLPPTLSITANNTLYNLLIPPASSADIRWTSSNQAPNSCSVTYTAVGGSCITAAKSIQTQGAYNWKAFTIGADTYLALANAYDGISYNVDSKIFKWTPSGTGCPGFGDGTKCDGTTPYQSIATNGAAKWESFVIGADTYFAVANSRNDTTRNVSSNIYKWTIAPGCPASGGLGDGTTCGSVYQAIATNGAVDLKPITVGADTYLAVANYRDDSSYTINSNIYKWMAYTPSNNCPHIGNSGGGFGDGTACGEVLQSIPTKGAYRMESFVLENVSYLAVTNSYAPAAEIGYNQPSYLYKFIASGYNCPAGGGFGNSEYGSCGTPAQTIDTSGAYGFKFFTIGNVSYLAVANAYNGTSFNINSKIYQWMPVSKCFGNGTTCGSAFQSIATAGATQLQTFTTGPDTYLIAANAYNGASYNVNSNFYQWMPNSQCFGNNASCGAALQAIPTSGAAWWEPMTINGDIYLATANYFNGTTRNINSSIMKWSPSGCGDEELGTPTTWTSDQSPSPNGYSTGLFSGSRLYTLACKWLDGTTASSTSVRVTTQTELMLSANGSTTPTVYITPDTSALIQWSSKGVQQNSCHVTNTADASDWAADNNPVGYPSPELADGESVTYTLACTDLVGAAATKVMTVTGATPLPSAASDLSISVRRVVRGGRPTLTWSVINLNPGISCTVTPALQSGVPEWDGTGTSWSSPLGGALGPIINTTTTFTLACVNKAGNSASVSATAYLVPEFKEL